MYAQWLARSDIGLIDTQGRDAITFLLLVVVKKQ